MKLAFLIQGEGRGHITQAISLYKILKLNGHVVGVCFVGEKGYDFLQSSNLECPIYSCNSLTIEYDSEHSFNAFKTIAQFFKKIPLFVKEVNHISKHFKNNHFDAIINFYEPLGGLYKLTNPRCKIPFISVAHQYTLLNPLHPRPKESASQWLLHTYTRFTSFGSSKILALSFAPKICSKSIIKYVPPLIRQELYDLHTSKENFVLVYLTEPSTIDDIINWHKLHQDIKVNYYGKKKPRYYHPNFQYFKPDLTTFISSLASCSSVICSAGFELICEARYLGKPVYAVPVKKHIEQAYNAYDITSNGIGLSSSTFSKEIFKNSTNYTGDFAFKTWVKKGEYTFLKEITNSFKIQGYNSGKERL